MKTALGLQLWDNAVIWEIYSRKIHLPFLFVQFR